MQIFFHCADGYGGNELMLTRSFEMTMWSLSKKQETEKKVMANLQITRVSNRHQGHPSPPPQAALLPSLKRELGEQAGTARVLSLHA